MLVFDDLAFWLFFMARLTRRKGIQRSIQSIQLDIDRRLFTSIPPGNTWSRVNRIRIEALTDPFQVTKPKSNYKSPKNQYTIPDDQKAAAGSDGKKKLIMLNTSNSKWYIHNLFIFLKNLIQCSNVHLQVRINVTILIFLFIFQIIWHEGLILPFFWILLNSLALNWNGVTKISLD